MRLHYSVWGLVPPTAAMGVHRQSPKSRSQGEDWNPQEECWDLNLVPAMRLRIRHRGAGVYKRSLGKHLANHPAVTLGNQTAMTGLATITDFKVHQRPLLINTPTGGVVRRNSVSHDMQLDQATSLSPAYHLTGTTGGNNAVMGLV